MGSLTLACGLITPPEPTPTPSHTPAPTLTSTATSQPVVAPTEESASAWQRFETEGFEVSLPASWESFPLDREDLDLIKGMWEASNPRVAEYIDIFIQAGLLERIDFWAIDTEVTQFVSNVNILSLPLPISLGAYLESSESEMERMQATVVSTNDSLEISGLPAARIEYRMPMEIGGSGIVVAAGVQYGVFADSRTYVLTFTAAEAQIDEMAPIFEMSAYSFRVLDG